MENANQSITTNVPVEPIVVPVAKTETPKADEERIMALKSLLVSSGWAVMIEVLNANIKYLEGIVLDRKDIYTNEPVEDEKEIEEARLKRALSVELRDLPNTLIRKARTVNTPDEEDNDDPYPKTQNDLDQMKKEEREEKE